jgi:hypothetical protein
LSEAYPHLLVQDPRAPGGQYYALFSNTIANGKVTGEDYTFCNLWMALGNKVWIDPNLSFEHLGIKGWRGNLSSTLIAMGAETADEPQDSAA